MEGNGAATILHADLDALGDDLALDRALEVETLADGAGGGEELVGRQVEGHPANVRAYQDSQWTMRSIGRRDAGLKSVPLV